MPVLTQLNLNVGTEQNPNMVLHDLHDIRISSTDVTTVTRLLGCDAGVNSIAPLTLANAASLLGANGLFGGLNETEYQDLNDLKKGIYYNGNAGNSDYINYPSSIINSGDTQIVVIAIANASGARGYQIAFSKLGLAIRFNYGTWKPWEEKLWSKWPND